MPLAFTSPFALSRFSVSQFTPLRQVCQRRVSRPSARKFAVMQLKSPVESERIRKLNDRPINNDGDFVLYWMQNSVRTIHNPALEHAAFLAESLKKPLRCLFVLPTIAQDNSLFTKRHAAFLIEGIADVVRIMKERRIPFAVLNQSAIEDVIDRAAEGIAKSAAVVVTDAGYLRPAITARQKMANTLSTSVIVVEGDVVVPVEIASNKQEHAARTIRPKINEKLDRFLQPLEPVNLTHQEETSVEDWIGADNNELLQENIENPQEVMASMKLDLEVPVIKSFRGGQVRAYKLLDQFITKRLIDYADHRNHPDKQLQSDLSPYLRAGNISPVDIAIRVKAATAGKKAMSSGVSSFLEELIVRRELAANACWYNPGYDTYDDIVPEFALISLQAHKADRRPKIYTYEQLEAGCTDDVYWNAAQLQLIVHGKMHGYMRMYWAKQIIGWVEDPEDAMNISLRLNNRWELDAVDPNSYVGVIWCYGLHDQGWREREIWGKVRYMNAAGLKRKYDIDAYVAMVDHMIAKEGLPEHIKKIREENKATLRQGTLDNMLTKKRSTSKKKTPRKASIKAKDTAKVAEKRKQNQEAKDRLLAAVKRLKS